MSRVESDIVDDDYQYDIVDDLAPSGESVPDGLAATGQLVSVRKYFPETFLWEFIDVDGLVVNCNALPYYVMIAVSSVMSLACEFFSLRIRRNDMTVEIA